MRLVKEQCVGLIIDLQEKLVPHMQNNEELIKRNKILIEGMQTLKLPILFSQQYSKGLGNTIDPIKSLMAGFNYFEKNVFSCCRADGLLSKLNQIYRNNVIIGGVEAHVCVLQTVVDLIEKGFQPIVVEDCVSSRNENDKRTAIERMRQEGAIISTSESILFELLNKAGTEEFKSISKLVK